VAKPFIEFSFPEWYANKFNFDGSTLTENLELLERGDLLMSERVDAVEAATLHLLEDVRKAGKAALALVASESN
jgi:hypothetical protein